MRVRAEAFTAPKAGNTESEYEDAVWPERALSITGDEFRCAVADGATETSYSRSWAHLLVGAYAYRQLEGPEPDEIAKVRSRWQRAVDLRLRRPHPWYADIKARSGAFAALVTLKFADAAPAGGHWSSYAVGDSCLIQLRGGAPRATFPIGASSEFNDRPRLLGSVVAPGLDGHVDVLRAEGDWTPDDTFYLLTDAIAAWFFRECESGGRPWEILGRLDNADRAMFREWVDGLRDAKALKNDDVTVLRLRFVANESK